MAIIAFEGNSFLGKSTYAKALAERQVIPLIEEYYFYLRKDVFPPFPPTSLDAALAQVDFLFELEHRRRTDIMGALQRSQHIILDRSVFTFPALRYAAHLQGLPFSTEAYEYCLAKIARGEGIIPDILVLMDVSDVDYQQRVLSRGRLPVEILNHVETKKGIHRFFTKEIFPNFPVLPVIFTPHEGDIEQSVNLLEETLARQLQLSEVKFDLIKHV